MTNIKKSKFSLLENDLYVIIDPTYFIPNYLWEDFEYNFLENNKKGKYSKIITIEDIPIFIGSVLNSDTYFIANNNSVEIRGKNWIELDKYISCILVDDMIKLIGHLPENISLLKILKSTFINYQDYIMDGCIYIDTTI